MGSSLLLHRAQEALSICYTLWRKIEHIKSTVSNSCFDDRHECTPINKETAVFCPKNAQAGFAWWMRALC
eukprot:scaffold45827_cov20-Tisochrysis_lutea.AAC.1